MSTGIMRPHIELKQIIALVLTHHFITARFWTQPKTFVQSVERELLLGLGIDERERVREIRVLLVPVPEGGFHTDTLMAEATLERAFWFFNRPDEMS